MINSLFIIVYLALAFLSFNHVKAQPSNEAVLYMRKSLSESPFGKLYYLNLLYIDKKDSTFRFQNRGFSTKDDREKNSLPVVEETYLGRWTLQADTLKLSVDMPSNSQGKIFKFLTKKDKIYFITDDDRYKLIKGKKYPWRRFVNK